MDNESYNTYEEFSHYLYEHPFGNIDELNEKFDERLVKSLCALGFLKESICGNYTLTKKGKEFLDLKYKPITLWERIVDFYYFKILGVKFNL